MNTFEIVVGDEGVDHAYFVTRKEQCWSSCLVLRGGES